MLKKMFVRTLMIGLFGASLGGCVVTPGGYYSDAGYAYSGPPVAAGYYNYWYYPGARVYYDIQRHVYFYPSNGGWVRVRELPEAWRYRLGRHETIHSRYERPYLDHDEHRREYPAYRYAPPVKKVPDQYRYRPQYDQRNSRRDERYDHRDNERNDNRRNERSPRYYSAPEKNSRREDRSSSHDNRRSEKNKYDRKRHEDRSNNYDRQDQQQQYQQAPSKY